MVFPVPVGITTIIFIIHSSVVCFKVSSQELRRQIVFVPVLEKKVSDFKHCVVSDDWNRKTGVGTQYEGIVTPLEFSLDDTKAFQSIEE